MSAEPGPERRDMRQQIRDVFVEIIRGFRIFDDPPDGARHFFFVWIGLAGFLRSVFDGVVTLPN